MQQGSWNIGWEFFIDVAHRSSSEIIQSERPPFSAITLDYTLEGKVACQMPLGFPNCRVQPISYGDATAAG